MNTTLWRDQNNFKLLLGLLFFLPLWLKGQTDTMVNKSDESYQPVLGLVQQAATFPGGRDSLISYLSAKLQFSAKEGKDIPNSVLVNFIVEKNGDLSDIRVYNKVPKGAANKIETVFENMPAWEPAMYRGKAVRARSSVKIPFVRQNN